MLSDLFFFLKIALALWRLSWFQHILVLFVLFVKNYIGILIEITLSLWIALCNMDILTLILPNNEYRLFSHLFVLQSLSSVSNNFHCTGLSSPWLNLFLDISFLLMQLYMEFLKFLCGR